MAKKAATPKKSATATKRPFKQSVADSITEAHNAELDRRGYDRAKRKAFLASATPSDRGLN